MVLAYVAGICAPCWPGVLHHECPKCDRAYSFISSLERHIAKAHPVTLPPTPAQLMFNRLRMEWPIDEGSGQKWYTWDCLSNLIFCFVIFFLLRLYVWPVLYFYIQIKRNTQNIYNRLAFFCFLFECQQRDSLSIGIFSADLWSFY